MNKKMETKKRILLSLDGKKELAAIFSISLPTVYDALNFKSKTKLAKVDPAKIRKAALEKGGTPIGFEAKKKKSAICIETIHHTAEGRMIQVFSPRVRVIVENMTGDGLPVVGVEVDGEIKGTQEGDMTLDEYTKILEKAQKIAEQLSF